ncbi:hypothetical protein ACMBCN_02005, partial [Candidatus Liberibacter asiaticus]|nr:hypothetical protein [Candidatus Liberibacter asiaticus]
FFRILHEKCGASMIEGSLRFIIISVVNETWLTILSTSYILMGAGLGFSIRQSFTKFVGVGYSLKIKIKIKNKCLIIYNMFQNNKIFDKIINIL